MVAKVAETFGNRRECVMRMDVVSYDAAKVGGVGLTACGWSELLASFATVLFATVLFATVVLFHRCHRIRSSSSGTATLACFGTIRGVKSDAERVVATVVPYVAQFSAASTGGSVRNIS